MKVHPVILFDGVCNFCDSTINLVIRRDKKHRIKFAPLQSMAGSQLLQQYGIDENAMDSFVFIENGKAYTKSTAALKVSRYMNRLWPLMAVFFIVPRPVRDAVYDYVAARRYKWFGKKDQCMIPTPDMRSRFLV
ncbi:MAG TPA: thiol-disulfide oxidoreductase DCC family protein [Ferruginibacter sp.]|nr:thiol-disulfide oxidoreductase DCC family protein [Ferruginibacter sp.]HMP20809.1 thiol-disulfide oxidoreductase DCC family protein [Ferruginibacter sp.]